jgi:hypothetical protein
MVDVLSCSLINISLIIMLTGSIKCLVCYSSSACPANVRARYTQAITKRNLALWICR